MTLPRQRARDLTTPPDPLFPRPLYPDDSGKSDPGKLRDLEPGSSAAGQDSELVQGEFMLVVPARYDAIHRNDHVVAEGPDRGSGRVKDRLVAGSAGDDRAGTGDLVPHRRLILVVNPGRDRSRSEGTRACAFSKVGLVRSILALW